MSACSSSTISRTSSALIESFGVILALGSSGLLVAVVMFGIEVFAPTSINNVKAEDAEACEAKRFTELILTYLADDALIRGYQLDTRLSVTRGFRCRCGVVNGMWSDFG